MEKIKIVHLTSVHSRFDVRIFLKECKSLSKAGFDVSLIVADGKGEQIAENIKIYDVGTQPTRFRRMLILPWKIYHIAKRINADIIHIHDPELLPIAFILQKSGKAVIYDSHEDVPRDIFSKHWIPFFLRKTLSIGFELFENFVAARLAGVIAATPTIETRFLKINNNCLAINNYPILEEFNQTQPSSAFPHAHAICYIGLISSIRCVKEMLQAVEMANVKFIMAGPFESLQLEQEVKQTEAWKNVDYRGVVSRAAMSEILAESRIGLVLFYPEPNHIEALPNKLFEYMAAGLPILASNFPLWENILRETGAGEVVDPLSPSDIANKITTLLSSEEDLNNMALSGISATSSKYSWSLEEQKLSKFYEGLMGKR
ncbi:glycosyltransferase family 4 protein [Paralcaligenes ginsengisoli]